MPKIIKLPNELIDKIAAGEIIESPASIIKELVENSLDAGANFIKVELTNGGTEKIRVIDNGSGMDKEDLIESVKKHTTSKIRTNEDLFNIKTLGFRGEALYSIAVSSKLNVKSQTKDSQIGYEINVKDGVLSKLSPLGMPTGTDVIVTNIFDRIPVRKKFIKSPYSELKKITDLMINFAISNCTVSFQLFNNNGLILNLPNDQDLLSRLSRVMGSSVPEKFLALKKTSEYITIEGYISKPQFYGEKYQYLVVNKRVVQNKNLKIQIRKSYGSLLQSKDIPHYVIFLTVPENIIDVNVHPKKEHIDFINENTILEALDESIKQTFSQNDLTQSYLNDSFSSFIYKDYGYDKTSAQHIKESGDIWNYKTSKIENNNEILQINNLYLIYQSDEGLEIVDQHAAHEKIIYENLLENYNKNGLITKNVNIRLSLPIDKKAILTKYLDILQQLGFEIDKNYVIKKIPVEVKDRDLNVLIAELIEDFDENGFHNDSKFYDEKTLRTISYISCRTAIKAGDYLTPEERKNIIEKLPLLKSNYTCPHGRPLRAKISFNELKKLFLRT